MTEVQAQGIFDAFKLLDKELIEKVLSIAKAINVQKLDGDLVRISIDVSIKQAGE
jgi:hypothetical protein